MAIGEHRDLMAAGAMSFGAMSAITGIWSMVFFSIPLFVAQMIGLLVCIYCGVRWVLINRRIDRQVDAEMRRYDEPSERRESRGWN